LQPAETELSHLPQAELKPPLHPSADYKALASKGHYHGSYNILQIRVLKLSTDNAFSKIATMLTETK
jgi:hypothetical protein